tara:strand:+ start:132 stop:521 length:390 start_codon:yes stop_codon:yes gene_type:complete
MRDNSGKTVGRYHPDENILIRKFDSYDRHILRYTHVPEEGEASTFDTDLIRNLEATVAKYGSSLDTLVLTDVYEDKDFNLLILYTEFLTHTDDKKNVYPHRGKNKNNYKQYEIPVKHMKKELKNGKSRT